MFAKTESSAPEQPLLARPGRSPPWLNGLQRSSAPAGQHDAAQRPVRPHRLDRVGRAGRLVLAAAREAAARRTAGRAARAPAAPARASTRPHAAAPRRARRRVCQPSRSSSSASSRCKAVQPLGVHELAAPGARHDHVVVTGRQIVAERPERLAERRLTRLRSTAPPTVRPTDTPEPCVGHPLASRPALLAPRAGKAYRTRWRLATERPLPVDTVEVGALREARAPCRVSPVRSRSDQAPLRPSAASAPSCAGA